MPQETKFIWNVTILNAFQKHRHERDFKAAPTSRKTYLDALRETEEWGFVFLFKNLIDRNPVNYLSFK